MYYSIRGKIQAVEPKFLVIETNGIGYEILVSKPESFNVGDDVFLYLYHHIREDDEYLAGFLDNDEKNAFKLLLHVNGIGPKSALQILSKITYKELLTAISNNDLETIEHIPGISSRIASQIFLDLRDFISKTNKENVSRYKEVKEALKKLKYKASEIDKVLPSIYIVDGTKEDIFKEALRRLSYAKNFG